MNQQSIVSETDGQGLASFDKLEGRIQNAIEHLRTARRRQAAADEEVDRLNQLLAEKDEEISRLTTELDQQRSEREQVRERIESLLDQIEMLAK